MKLRVKNNLSGNRNILQIEEDAHLKQLRASIRELVNLRHNNWDVSLNGKEPISGDEDVSLSSLGIVSGDLIHVIAMEPSQNDVIGQLHQMGFEKSLIDQIMTPSCNIDLETAIELLSSMQEHQAASSSTTTSKETSDSQAKELINQDMDQSEITSKETDLTESSMSSEDACMADRSSSKAVTIPPFLLQDGITRNLSELYSEEKVESVHDALMLAVHCLMQESGFQVVIPQDSLNKLPKEWKITAMGFYRLSYSHYTCKDLQCILTGSVAGNNVVVSGTVDSDDDETYQQKFKTVEYVNSTLDKDPNSVYKNLWKLSRQLKDSIVTPLLTHMQTKLGISHTIGIISLPNEMKQLLCRYLDISSICRLAGVCRDLLALTKDQNVWRMVLARDFRVTEVTGFQGTTKEAVKRMYRKRQEDRRREEERNRRPPMRPDFEIDYRHPDVTIPDVGSTMPGIIGGNYDLYPSGPYMPGGFPRNPLGPPERNPLLVDPSRNPGRNPFPRPPGARFDPYGPDPDIDFFQPDGPSGFGNGGGIGRGRGSFGSRGGFRDRDPFGGGGGFGGFM